MDEESKPLCLCRNVSAGVVRRAVAEGATTLRAVRRRTRAGTGPCGAVRCGEAIAAAILREREARRSEGRSG